MDKPGEVVVDNVVESKPVEAGPTAEDFRLLMKTMNDMAMVISSLKSQQLIINHPPTTPPETNADPKGKEKEKEEMKNPSSPLIISSSSSSSSSPSTESPAESNWTSSDDDQLARLLKKRNENLAPQPLIFNLSPIVGAIDDRGDDPSAIDDDSSDDESGGEEATIIAEALLEVRADPRRAVKYSRKPPSIDISNKLKGKYPFEKPQKYITWSTMVSNYLKTFHADYFLNRSRTSSWTRRDKLNHAIVYNWLCAQLQGNERAVAVAMKIENKSQACYVWAALRDRYDRMALVDVQNLERKWSQLKVGGSETATNFTDRVDAIADELQRLGSPVSELSKLNTMRSALLQDSRYETSVRATYLNPDVCYLAMKSSLLELDRATQGSKPRQGATAKDEEQHGLSANQQTNQDRAKTRTCFHCGRTGHYKSDCPIKDKPQTPDGLAAVEKFKKAMKSRNKGKKDYSTVSVSSVVDSGTTPKSIFPPSNAITNVRRRETVIGIADKNTTIVARETGKTPLFQGEDPVEVIVTDRVREPLISVLQVANVNNISTVFDRDGVRFVKGKVDLDPSLIKGKGIILGGQYRYDVPSSPSSLHNAQHENRTEAEVKSDGNHCLFNAEETSAPLGGAQDQLRSILKRSIYESVENEMEGIEALYREDGEMDDEFATSNIELLGQNLEMHVGKKGSGDESVRFAEPETVASESRCKRKESPKPIASGDESYKPLVPYNLKEASASDSVAGAIWRSLVNVLKKLKPPRRKPKKKRAAQRQYDPTIELEEETFHNRCGHLSEVRRTIESGAIRGKIPIWEKLKKMDKHMPCIHCLAGKMKQRHYDGPTEPTVWKPGESLHVDNCEMPVLSLSGMKHEFEVEDEATGCLFGVPQAKRKTSGDNLIKIVAWIERQSGNKVKRVVCDGASEFIQPGSVMMQWASENGVEMVPSTSHTSNENNIAENAHKRRDEVGRTIRIKARLPPPFWAEASRFARIIKARILQKKQTKTGFEQFYCYKPTLSDIHVFGCVAIVWRRPDQRNKLESRALPCIYLGPQGKGHRFYNVLTNKVFQASTAIWAEKSFGIQNAKKLCEQIGLKSWVDEDDDDFFYDEDDVSTECIDVEKELSKTNLPPPTDPEHLFLNPLITNVLDTPEAPEPLDDTPARRPKRERYPDAPNPIPVASIEDNDDEDDNDRVHDLTLMEVLHETLPLNIDSAPGEQPPEVENPMDVISNPEPEPPPLPTIGASRYPSRKRNVPIELSQDKYGMLCRQYMLKAQSLALGPKTPRGYKQAGSGDDGPKWMRSMKAEYDTHVTNGTFGDLIPRSLAEARRASSPKKYFYIVDGLWKYRVKTKNGVVDKLKSRFCANGSTQDASPEETFSPTARMATIRMLIALAAEFGADVRNGDIPGAYLNAPIDDDTEIYISQPKGFEVEGKEDWVYRLEKALYGLKQAGKLWNSLLHTYLLEIGFKQNIADPCLYYKRSDPNDKKSGLLVLAITVDDFLYFGTEQTMVDEFIASLEGRFDYIDEGLAEWFLGMCIEQDCETIKLSQKDYINTITREWPNVYPTFSPVKTNSILQPPTKPVNPKFKYRKLCGQLRYVTLTRPEIEFPLNQCCKYQEKWDDTHIAALLKIVGYLKRFPYIPLCYRKNRNPSSDLIIQLTGVADSSFADQPLRLSSYGFLVRLNGMTVAWKGRSTPTVATSSAAAEYVAIAECLKELLHTMQVLEGLELTVEIPMIILTDSTGAIGIANFRKVHDRSKHIDVRYHFTRERITDGTLRLKKVPTDENAADIFTKPLGATKMSKFLNDIVNPT